MIRPAANSSPVHDAWILYDETTLVLTDLYRLAAQDGDTPARRAERLTMAETSVHLWARWRDLFLAEQKGRVAA